MAKKPPLFLRIRTRQSPTGPIKYDSRHVYSDMLQEEGLAAATTAVAGLRRERLKIVRHKVERDIGKLSDAKCARRWLRAVNAELHRRGFAIYPKEKALAKAIGRIRRQRP
jgi:hypothetical protein